MPNRSQDWFRQAEDSQREGHHEWACSAAQQSAEKSVQALRLSLGQEAWGHVVARLPRDLPGASAIPSALIEKARILDSCYIPPRYPNSHSEGSPFEHYGPPQEPGGHPPCP